MTRPYVLMQVGSSLDGKVAAESGQETIISSQESFKILYGLRDACDAVAFGHSTVEIDEPQLSTRSTRVIFDSALKLDRKHQIFEGENYIVIHDIGLGEKGEKFIGVQHEPDGLSVPQALSALVKRGVKSLLVEGGPKLWTSFLNAHAVDEIWWFQSPIILGSRGVDALGNLSEEALAWMAADTHESQSFQIDRDTLTIMRIQKSP